MESQEDTGRKQPLQEEGMSKEGDMAGAQVSQQKRAMYAERSRNSLYCGRD
jgi:hypothetical protein